MKIRAIILAVILVITAAANSYAAYTDVPEASSYAGAVERLSVLGIMSGEGNNSFKPDQILTREQFAKLIVTIAGLGDDALSFRGSTAFPDVSAKNPLKGYIYVALSKGFIAGMADGKFHPADKITYAQACTAFIRVLGYTDQDLQGFWPDNYLNKAKLLKLTSGLAIKSNDGLPKWAAAVVIDRLIATNVKKTGQAVDKALYQASGLYTDCIILGNSDTYEGLLDSQVLTDKGIFDITGKGIKLDVGNEYWLKTDGTDILSVYYKLKMIKTVLIDSITKTSLTYTENNKKVTMALPVKTIYYYRGVKQSYDSLKNTLQKNMTILFAGSEGSKVYDFAVILNPEDVIQGTYMECLILGNADTFDGLQDKQVYTDKGIYNISGSNIKLEVGNKYRLEIEDGDIIKVQEKLMTIKTLTIDSIDKNNITYTLKGKTETLILPVKTTYYYQGVKQNYENLKNLLQKNMSLIFASGEGSTDYDYAVIADTKDSKLGTYGEYIILGNSKISDKYKSNQVLTDKGILTLIDTSVKLELGNKYGLVVSDGKIARAYGKLMDLTGITIESSLDSRVLYKDGDGAENTMMLPDKTVYYYNGVKQAYDSLKNILQAKTSVIFAGTANTNGYEYAVIFDPVFSKPEVGYKLDLSRKMVGNLDYSGITAVIRNSEESNLLKIENTDVIYKVSDIWNRNSHLLVIGNKVDGRFKAFLPGRASAKQIQIDAKTYDFSKDMDLKKITGSSAGFSVGDNVTALLGYDGKVVDVIYPDIDTSNNAFVVNYSAASAGGTYLVKLLLTDGTYVQYKVKSDPSSLKGHLITYTKVDDETVTILEVTYPGLLRDYYVRKDQKMIDAFYVTDDVKIFSLISNNIGTDAQFNILNWSDIPYGTIPSGCILYINKAGVFGDINFIVANDILNQRIKLGLVKNIDVKVSGGKSANVTTTVTIVAEGKEYTYNSAIPMAFIGSAVKLTMSAGGIESVTETLQPAAEAFKIQAVDIKRIMLGNSVYRFRDDVAIYKKDITGAISLIGKNDIDTSATYGKVSIYTDSNNLVSLVYISEN